MHEYQYDVVVDGRTIATCNSSNRARKEAERFHNRMVEVSVIEHLCFPALLLCMYTINKEHTEKNKDAYGEAIQRLRNYIKQLSSDKGPTQEKLRIRRLNKLTDTSIAWIEKQKMDTRKVSLICAQLMSALHQTGYVSYEENILELLRRIDDQLETARSKIEGFDKIEASVIKKTFPLLEQIQKAGYFRYEGIY